MLISVCPSTWTTSAEKRDKQRRWGGERSGTEEGKVGNGESGGEAEERSGYIEGRCVCVHVCVCVIVKMAFSLLLLCCWCYTI